MAFLGQNSALLSWNVESMHALGKDLNSLTQAAVFSLCCVAGKDLNAHLQEDYLLKNMGFEVRQICKSKFPVKGG